MAVDVTSTLVKMLARNRGPNPLNPGTPLPPDYGVTASLEGNTLAMVLTFRSGSSYCCMEWGCHLPFPGSKRWDSLRMALDADEIPAPPKLELRLSCVVEDGAVFFDPLKPDPTRWGWYALRPVPALHYQISATECDR
jgi:hypothetical protein